MHETRTPRDSVQDDLWRSLPGSNLHRQKKLTGWRDLDEQLDEDATIERRHFRIEMDRYAQLNACRDGAGWDVDTVMLAVYHLVMQWYLDDLESLIGACLVSPDVYDAGSARVRTMMVRPSYVYAEDDDAVEQLLRDVARQSRGGNEAAPEPDPASSWRSSRAPIFFYVGGRGLSAPDGAIDDLLSSDLPQRRVVVSPLIRADHAEVHVLMPSAIARTIGIDGFLGRYDSTFSLLLTNTGSRVGEIKERLGKPADVPYRQLEEMQRRVIALWARVLGTPEEGLAESSNYYEVGGTSLNAFKLLNRVRVEFQRDISLWDIIENPTIQQFSRLLLKD